MSSNAQTIDGPESACSGELLQVEWTGPNAARDAITIARVDAAADRYLDVAWTAGGDPARLHAPVGTGRYELRYVQGEPQEVLAKEFLDVEQCEEFPRVAVTFQGTQIDHGSEIDTSESTQYGPAGMTIDQFCQAGELYAQVLGTMVDHINAEMHSAGVPVGVDAVVAGAGGPTRASIARNAEVARDEICDQPPPQTITQPFIITYAHCRMAMLTPTHALDIHLPPGGGGGTMSAADFGEGQVMVMNLQSSVEQVSAIIGKGWDEGLSLNGPVATGTRAGFPASVYDFKYEVGLGGSENPLGMLGQTIKVKNEGTVWLSSEVPGMDIVQLFYQRLTTEMSPQGNAMSFFGGLINNLVAMLSVGVPLEMDQTTSSKALGAIVVSGRSQSFITGVELLDFDQQWCDSSLMPPDFEVVDIDQQLAEAMGGQDSAEMAAAMEEYNQAMAQMTPEQRAMMERMGMADMMNQAMGGAGEGTPAPSSGCNMPSSTELTSNNMLQSVQKHLEALGYSTGNTNGDASLDTTIAISQFQAEKRIDVTGEVSPQLLRALAAEVDKGC